MLQTCISSICHAHIRSLRPCVTVHPKLVPRTRYSGAHTHTRPQSFPFPTHLKTPTPHDIFHLPPTASQQDIKARYYDLVRSHHPDCVACRALPRTVAHSRFQAVTHAYEVLTGKRKPRGGAATSSEAAEIARRRASYRAAYTSGRPYTGGRNEWGGFEYTDSGSHRTQHNRGDLMGSQAFYVAIAVMSVVLVSLHATHISPLLASRPTSSVSVADRRHTEARLALEQARLKGQEHGEERRGEIRKWVKEAGLEGLGQKVGHGPQRKETGQDQ